MWVIPIAGSTGSALRAVRPPNLHITPNLRRDLVHAASATLVALAPGHHGPSHSGDLVGERDRLAQTPVRLRRPIPLTPPKAKTIYHYSRSRKQGNSPSSSRVRFRFISLRASASVGACFAPTGPDVYFLGMCTQMARPIIASSTRPASSRSLLRSPPTRRRKRSAASCEAPGPDFFLPAAVLVRRRRSASRWSTVSLLHSFPSRAVQKLQFRHPVNRVPSLLISLQGCPQM